MLKTFTPTGLRQDLFKILGQSLKDNDTIQITCGSHAYHYQNQNFYILNQKEFDNYLRFRKLAPLLKKFKKELDKQAY